MAVRGRHRRQLLPAQAVSRRAGKGFRLPAPRIPGSAHRAVRGILGAPQVPRSAPQWGADQCHRRWIEPEAGAGSVGIEESGHSADERSGERQDSRQLLPRRRPCHKPAFLAGMVPRNVWLGNGSTCRRSAPRRSSPDARRSRSRGRRRSRRAARSPRVGSTARRTPRCARNVWSGPACPGHRPRTPMESTSPSKEL
jgi:hypothetical protein